VRILEAPDRSHVGVAGRVVDESRNMLHIERCDGNSHESGNKPKTLKVPKSGAVFEFALGDGNSVRVRGDSIAFRPEDRVKKAR
jgi:ribonuclease P protein subunit POP4